MAQPIIDIDSGLVPINQTNVPAPPPGFVVDKPQPATAHGAVPAPPPGFTLDQPIDLDAGLVPITSQTEPSSPQHNTATNVGIGMAKGATGTVSGIDDLVSKIPVVGKWLTTPWIGHDTSQQAIAREQAFSQPHGGAQDAGADIEGVAEFLAGDEALKGLALSDRLAKTAKIAKVLEENPKLAALAHAGITAMRQGTVAGAQGLAHGSTPDQALHQGELAGAAGGMIDIGGKALAKLPLGEEASRLYARALAPTGNADKAAAREVAPELSRRIPFAWSLQGLKDKAATYLDQAEQRLQAVEDALPADQKVDLEPVRKGLRNFASQYTVDADPDAAPTVVEHQSKLLDAHGQPIITVETTPAPTTVEDSTKFGRAARGTAQNIADQLGRIDPRIRNVIAQRRILDAGLKSVYNGADPEVSGSVLAQQRAANILRGQLASTSPEMASANREYSFWRKVNDVAGHTLQRRTGQTGGLMHLAGGAWGMEQLATGHPKRAAEIFGGFEGARALMQSPMGLTLSARLLNKLAGAVGDGNIHGAMKLLVQQAGPGAAAAFMRGYQQARTPQNQNLVGETFILPSGRQVQRGDQVTYNGQTGTVHGQHRNGKAIINWNQGGK